MARMALALRADTGKLTSVDGVATAVFHDRVTDTLYVASGTDVYALFSETTRKEGWWRGRVEIMSDYGGFGWLAVNSRFVDADGTATPVTIRLYGDDDGTNTSTRAMIFEAEVTALAPIRMPAYLGREFIVDVTSKARVESVTFATTAKELKATV
jgi:hypothetical protein